jgi:chaperonin GroES
MGVKIQPLSDYVVAQDEKAESKTASGLYLPDSAKEKPKTAIVVAVGPDAKQVKVGDQIDREDYLLVKEEDVLATVKKDK